MKKSYIFILIFELVIFTFAILNSFNTSILSVYGLPIIVFVGLAVFNYFLRFEKDRFVYKSYAYIDILQTFIAFILIYYVLGILVGFVKTVNYFTLYRFFMMLFPLILYVIGRELLRYSILKKSEESKILIVITCLLFIFLDCSTKMPIVNFSSANEVFKFIALTVLPSITTNILLCYLSLEFGYKASVLYTSLMTFYLYIVPIVPAPSDYIKSLIDFILPVIFMIRIYRLFSSRRRIEEFVARNNNKSVIKGFILPIVLVCVIVYLVSGYFKYYAVAIASGSMKPVFDRGAVVILDTKCNIFEKGDIIAYRKGKIIVVHRIINVVNVLGERHYFTKGDANDNEDGIDITKDDIVGVVKLKIPYIGYPTVWLSEA